MMSSRLSSFLAANVRVVAGIRTISTAPPYAKHTAHAPSCACGACGSGRIAGKPISERGLVSSSGATNRGVVYMGPGEVEVRAIEYPKLELDSTSSPVVSERQARAHTWPMGPMK